MTQTEQTIHSTLRARFPKAIIETTRTNRGYNILLTVFESTIFDEVAEAAAEICRITLDELKSGDQYGNIPQARQMIAYVLSCHGHGPAEIQANLPFMGTQPAIVNQVRTARRKDKTDRKFRRALHQLIQKYER